MEELNKYLGNNGQLFTGKEVWGLMQRWRETFAAKVKEETGKWNIGNVDWHVFSYNYYPV